MKLRVFLSIALLTIVAVGCSTVYYSAWEKVGVYKRDLLKKRVVAARDGEKAAGEQFKTALTRIQEMYGFDGGSVEKTYSAMQRDYDRSVERADAVRKRVQDVETVAADLFSEWEKEIQQISSSSLRSSSRDMLRQTKSRYDEMHTALKRAEQSMEPVLIRFHDQVLFLKHNLNAAAIASLKGESTNIQTEISKLLQDMNTAIEHADGFIKTLQP